MSIVNRCGINLEDAFRARKPATNPVSGYKAVISDVKASACFNVERAHSHVLYPGSRLVRGSVAERGGRSYMG